MNVDQWTDEGALEYLTRDGGIVPCSRWGRTSSECAPVAIDLARIFREANGDEWTTELLDVCMSAVVNDDDYIEDTIRDHGTYDMRAKWLKEETL